MSPFAFDTLSASKQLREAGMSEGVAEAVVSVFQHAATMPDISHLATKADLEALGVAARADIDALSAATKVDLEALGAATRSDIAALAMSTKADIDALRSEMSTKADIAEVRLEVANLRADLQATIRQQGWLIMGGVGVVVTISNTMLKVFA